MCRSVACDDKEAASGAKGSASIGDQAQPRQRAAQGPAGPCRDIKTLAKTLALAWELVGEVGNRRCAEVKKFAPKPSS